MVYNSVAKNSSIQCFAVIPDLWGKVLADLKSKGLQIGGPVEFDKKPSCHINNFWKVVFDINSPPTAHFLQIDSMESYQIQYL